MIITTIYTLYGRRAGAELCFERTVDAIHQQYENVQWVILCNRSAKDVIEKEMPYAKPIYVSWLDNQYKKAFWLEFKAGKFVDNLNADCFWIPSGCNHFPGKWHIPTLSTFHDLGEYHVANKYSKTRMIFRKSICIPKNIKRAKRFTAVSEFTRKDMVRFLGMNEQQIKVVYNGASPHKTEIRTTSLPTIDKYGLKNKQYFFVPGRTDYIGKGLDILFDAYKQFVANHNDIKLVFVGPEGEGHILFVDAINSNSLKKNAMYLGRVDNDVLSSLYSHCMATIIASRFEGFGFPVLEAMQYGVPIICSDAGALKEVAGDAALIFKSGQPDQLLSMMERTALASPETINELSIKGKERLSLFSWERCAKEMYGEFQLVVNDKT